MQKLDISKALEQRRSFNALRKQLKDAFLRLLFSPKKPPIPHEPHPVILPLREVARFNPEKGKVEFSWEKPTSHQLLQREI
jgi:hypothetical protein